jgi:hypothetical protein
LGAFEAFLARREKFQALKQQERPNEERRRRAAILGALPISEGDDRLGRAVAASLRLPAEIVEYDLEAMRTVGQVVRTRPGRYRAVGRADVVWSGKGSLVDVQSPVFRQP